MISEKSINALILFQPTPPSREATPILGLKSFFIVYFNPHLPRGRRRVGDHPLVQQTLISTHTSLAGGDRCGKAPRLARCGFQPTPPSREATNRITSVSMEYGISTHTSLAGGDSNCSQFYLIFLYKITILSPFFQLNPSFF